MKDLSATKTTTEILERLRDPSETKVWSSFIHRYRPAVVSYAKRCGLQHTDADDVAQESLLAFLKSYATGKYDRSRGRLRDWIRGIVVNRIRESFRQSAKLRECSIGSGDLVTFDTVQSDGDAWEAEWDSHIVALCFHAIQTEFEPTTLKAFELYALKQQCPADVAEELGISPNAVYVAKSRVRTRLRQLYRDLDEADDGKA